MSVGALRVGQPHRSRRPRRPRQPPRPYDDVDRARAPRPRGGRAAALPALLALLGSAFSALALTAAPHRADVTTAVMVAAGGSGVLAAYSLVRGRRAPTWRRWLLGGACLALSATGAVLATAPPGGAVDSPRLDRTGWLALLAALVLPGLGIGALLSELRARLTQIAHLSKTDHLTGIANRLAWEEELPREGARARRDATPACVAIIDVDQLGSFNELRGHPEGDVLLRRVASTWQGAVRACDLIARLDGGRFGLLLRKCPLEHAVVIVERMRVTMPQAQTASAGIATWDGAEPPASVIARAEAALRAAKRRGRDRVSIAMARGGGDDDLGDDWAPVVRQLVENRSVVPVYQPIVDLSTGGVVAYEALARPNGLDIDISVERMFTTAQRLGLSRELDWVCRRAALADVSWLPPAVLLFINCNAGLLTDPVHRVDQMLLVAEAANIRPNNIVFEITERDLARDLRRLGSVVDAYRREGFQFAIDDVGEGHSTLELLATVRPEFIKVARSLVIEAGNVGSRAAICAIVAFARESGAQVIAEGIELPQSAANMRELGVELAQGYLFGRPALQSAAA